MGCCASKDDKDNLEVVLSGRKGCTDPICCCIFLLFWIIFLLIFAFGLFFGQPQNIIYGMDYQGHSCGDSKFHPGAKEFNCTADNLCPYIYYPRLTEDAAIGALSNKFVAFGVCLPKCPVANQVICTYEYQDQYGLPTLEDTQYCRDSDYRKQHATLCENCWISPLNTTSVVFRCIPIEAEVKQSEAVCTIPPSPEDPSDPNYISADDPRCQARLVTTTTRSTQPTDIDIITNQLSSIMGMFSSLLQDLEHGYFLILGEVLLAIIFGFIFTSLITVCAKFLIWVILLLIVICCILVTLYCYSKGTLFNVMDGINWLLNITGTFIDYNVTDVNVTISGLVNTNIAGLSQTPETWNIVAYVFTFITIVVLIIVCALASMVNTSSKIIKETTRGVLQMPLLLCCPILVAIIAAIVIFFFIVSTVLIASSNLSFSESANVILDTVVDNVPGSNITRFCRDNTQETDCTLLPQYFEGNNALTWIIGFFNLYGLFWTVEFITGICSMLIAGAIAKWYFTRPNEKGTKPGVGNGTVIESLVTVIRCHLGSIAFGSCCIAIISVLRSILLYIEKKSKASENKMCNCFFKCCHCCLWCLEKCLRYLSKNAYIIVISRNKNFCTACVKSFNLLFQNIGQVTLLNSVTLIFFWLGKLLAAVLCGVSCYYLCVSVEIFQSGGMYQIYDPIPITILCALLGYIIFSCFTVVYDSAIDTILLCYCEDKTYFKEKNQPGYSNAELDKVMNKRSKKEAKTTQDSTGEAVEMQQDSK